MLLLNIILFWFCLDLTNCSVGDRTYTFNRCTTFCTIKFCKNDTFLSEKVLPQQILNRKKINLMNKLEFLILWSCPKECKYICMWKTVSAFKNDGLDVPQFFGKWPLMRICGVEEVASAFAAFANLIVTNIMFKKFWEFVPKDSLYYSLWWLHYISSSITWVCAIIFHISDTWITEKLDYFSALFLAISASYLTILRIWNLTGKRIQWFIGFFCFTYFSIHIFYMLFVKFDYAYNMMVFIIIGTFNVISWLLWGIKNRNLSHSKYIMIWASWLAIFSILEVKEFTPIFWLFDSHSIWHYGTVFITIPLYKFAILDCQYMRNLEKKYD